ncbi:MAG: superoxide dismutase [Phycisphaeraceae bacterium]|nr:superoxide dismutase [Phycisphaeraceae bacterium]
MPFTLPALPFPANALVPAIDAATMEIHHGKHHKAYVDNANKALEGTPWADMDPVEVIKSLKDLPDEKRGAVRNNAGGHVNHSMFWSILAAPGTGGTPSGPLAEAINASFGSLDAMKEKFAAAAMGRFGSGWAWLCVKNGKLEICSTANQDNPLMGESVAGCGGTPILGLDVWEHAYYLNYQNRRADYVASFWTVVNWAKVQENFAKAK